MNTKMQFIDAPKIYRFDEVRECIERVVKHAVHGEYTAEDVRKMLIKGQAFCAYSKDDDGVVEIACVWEMIYYPRTTAVNVLALGGKNAKENWEKYGPTLMDLWKKQGADCVECATTKAVARLLMSAGVPIQPTYVLSRGYLK